MRGTQEASDDIVLVYLNQTDWNFLRGPSDGWMRSVKEFSSPTDSHFWKPAVWDELLGKILASNPRSVGVTFFFGPNLPLPNEKNENLFNPKVFWAGQLDNEGRPIMPITARVYGSNVASIDMREEEDHYLRRFTPGFGPLPHMALALTRSSADEATLMSHPTIGHSQLINFRGPRDSYRSIHAADVMAGRYPPDFFHGRTVIIGNSTLTHHYVQTPVGRLTRAEALAEMVDSVAGNRWIHRIPLGLAALYILAILILGVLIMRSYPQQVALVFLVWLGLGVAAVSLWAFDTFYLWLPIFSPLIALIMMYVILIGYQLTIKENLAWRLEQEKNLIFELDQLRNNFVSLISHDLKTPIAKIQAICDRLLSSSQLETEVRDGLTSLRQESVELHRYIQSILQLSKMESNSIKLRKEATDLNEVVEKVFEHVAPLATDKRQELSMALEPMFSLEIDGLMMQEVIMNLVENAIKYTPNDGAIEIRTEEIDDKVVFTVRDNGPGIPPEDRDRIFEKFFRGQAVQTQIKGTGLGLFLVKYFVELHGGEVFLDSELGRGTRVGFAIPLHH
ncbi:MAG: ATP-binding protein [Bdellovibrionales bacterium]